MLRTMKTVVNSIGDMIIPLCKAGENASKSLEIRSQDLILDAQFDQEQNALDRKTRLAALKEKAAKLE